MINLIPLPYRILFVILFVLGLGFGSYFYGYNSAVSKNKSDRELEVLRKNLEIEKLKTRS